MSRKQPVKRIWETTCNVAPVGADTPPAPVSCAVEPQNGSNGESDVPDWVKPENAKGPQHLSMEEASVPDQWRSHCSIVDRYIEHGWKLCQIPPGSKGPRTPGWQLELNALKSGSDLPAGHGVGLLHAYSGTMALDIDDWDDAVPMLMEEGIDLQGLYDAPDSVIVDSGRAGHGKLLYALPDGPMVTKRVIVDGKTIYELRCASTSGHSVQDVLPPSKHPSGSTYRWAGNGDWQKLPVISDKLLSLWRNLIEKDNEKRTYEGAGAGDKEIKASWPEIEYALEHIPASCKRDDWIAVGMALHWTGYQTNEMERARSNWDEWSQTCPERYPGEHEINTQWISFKAGKQNGKTLGSLFHIAGQHGWEPKEADASGLFGPIGGDTHPLARVVTLNTKPRPVKWVIPGVIQQGLVLIAGSSGAGKTTNLLPMLMRAAHLCHETAALRPPARRKIIWITEDQGQVERIISGMVMDGITTDDEVARWLKVVQAKRMPVDQIVKVEPHYQEHWTTAQGFKDPVSMPPLIVMDTKSAVIDLEDENANSAVSKAFAALKVAFDEYPVIVIAHLAKALKGRTEARELSVRGAGAIEADAHQILYLVQEENGDRYLVFGKTRFEKSPNIDEIKFVSHTNTMLLDGEFGPEQTTLRWSDAEPVSADERVNLKQLTKEEDDDRKLKKLMINMVPIVKAKNDAGEQIGRTLLGKLAGSNKSLHREAINRLIARKEIIEVDGNNTKMKLLYVPTEEERQTAIFTGNDALATAEGIDRIDPPK